MSRFILAIDQGTTSTRAIAFDLDFHPHASAQIELTQHFPEPGWVEHDAEEIWQATLAAARQVIAALGGPERVAAIGITNQRETTILWDRATGAPVHRAIVWQDRRTAERCAQLRAAGHEPNVQAATGLLLDPYFSATKIAWMLDRDPALRVRAERGEIAFGTVESYLAWRLTGGAVHVSDATNAARTLLFDIRRQSWSDELCALFGVPVGLLPRVVACDAYVGDAAPALFGRAIPIHGMAGDQQAALVGHGCLKPGMAKATFGTGAFLVMNMGAAAPQSQNRLLGTIGYRTQRDLAYALEGSIFSAGATVQWLRDGLRLIETSAESEAIAAALPDNGGVYLVPAFAGLGAPQWNADARGTIIGLTRDSRLDHIVRAGLEAVAYQTADLLDALRADGAQAIEGLLVDGGLTANAWAMQFLADICAVRVVRPAFQEMTALGAAKLAAYGAGLTESLDGAGAGPTTAWTPRLDGASRLALREGWHSAVAAALAAAGT